MLTTRHPATRLVVTILAVSALLGCLLVPAARADNSARYVLNVTSIKALDESGNDWLGSDEVYGGFEVKDSRTWEEIAGFRSQLIKGFDSGETKSLDPQRSCLPHRQVLDRGGVHWFLDARAGDRWLCERPGADPGIPAPFTVSSALYEQESCPYTCDILREEVLWPWLVDDEDLGEAVLHFSGSGLSVDLPRVGMSRTYPMEHRANGAAYRANLTVTRVG